MSGKQRFVFDTNVVVSAFLFQSSAPGRALLVALEAGEVLLSAQIATELTTVLRREKFDRYISQQKRDRLLKALIQGCVLIDVTSSIDACRDPKDNMVLELAVSGAAHCIISGDEDLLTLNPFREILILKPVDFLDWLNTQS
ncbi:MAG: putative toxin-antitoxin system toxin component, PIN family [Caldilineaceae bacterium]|nr:putative toxin-antitoxin system toxin component, PIN family [Caldilineaceae bacterium]